MRILSFLALASLLAGCAWEPGATTSCKSTQNEYTTRKEDARAHVIWSEGAEDFVVTRGPSMSSVQPVDRVVVAFNASDRPGDGGTPLNRLSPVAVVELTVKDGKATGQLIRCANPRLDLVINERKCKGSSEVDAVIEDLAGSDTVSGDDHRIVTRAKGSDASFTMTIDYGKDTTTTSSGYGC